MKDISNRNVLPHQSHAVINKENKEINSNLNQNKNQKIAIRKYINKLSVETKKQKEIRSNSKFKAQNKNLNPTLNPSKKFEIDNYINKNLIEESLQKESRNKFNNYSSIVNEGVFYKESMENSESKYHIDPTDQKNVNHQEESSNCKTENQEKSQQCKNEKSKFPLEDYLSKPKEKDNYIKEYKTARANIPNQHQISKCDKIYESTETLNLNQNYTTINQKHSKNLTQIQSKKLPSSRSQGRMNQGNLKFHNYLNSLEKFHKKYYKTLSNLEKEKYVELNHQLNILFDHNDNNPTHVLTLIYQVFDKYCKLKKEIKKQKKVENTVIHETLTEL